MAESAYLTRSMPPCCKTTQAVTRLGSGHCGRTSSGRDAGEILALSGDRRGVRCGPCRTANANTRLNGVGMNLRFEIFPSDLDATADFYRRVLRFEVTADRRGEPQPYMGFRRDAVRIGAARRARSAPFPPPAASRGGTGP